MTQPIYLLTDLVAGAALSTMLTDAGHDSPVVLVESREALDSLFAGTEGLPGRLVGFFTDILVPRRYLERLALQPVNFHPGPPEYPGKLPIKFALHDGADTYGVTAHVMAPKVDSGEILGVARFSIKPGMAEGALRYRTYQSGFRLFRHFLGALTGATDLVGVADAVWGPRVCSQAAYEALIAGGSERRM